MPSTLITMLPYVNVPAPLVVVVLPPTATNPVNAPTFAYETPFNVIADPKS